MRVILMLRRLAEIAAWCVVLAVVVVYFACWLFRDYAWRVTFAPAPQWIEEVEPRPPPSGTLTPQ